MAKRTTMFRMLLVAATAGFVSLLAPTTRAHALDCGDRLVAPGDPIGYVRAFCGDPISIVTRTITRNEVAFSGRTTVAVQVEVWVYDFGPDRLMVELTFQYGRLLFEQTLTQGTAAGHPPDGVANGHPYYTHRDSRAYHRHQ